MWGECEGVVRVLWECPAYDSISIRKSVGGWSSED